MSLFNNVIKMSVIAIKISLISLKMCEKNTTIEAVCHVILMNSHEMYGNVFLMPSIILLMSLEMSPILLFIKY